MGVGGGEAQVGQKCPVNTFPGTSPEQVSLLCFTVTSTLQPLSQLLLQEYTMDRLTVPLHPTALHPRVRD